MLQKVNVSFSVSLVNFVEQLYVYTCSGVNVIGENPTESNVSGMTQDMGSALNLWLAAAHNLYRSLQIFSNGN